MGDSKFFDEAGSYAIGGSTMIGVGVGFFFLKTNIFAFVACILIGVGAGLVIAAILGVLKK